MYLLLALWVLLTYSITIGILWSDGIIGLQQKLIPDHPASSVEPSGLRSSLLLSHKDRSPLSTCDLIKYSSVIVSTDAETIFQFRQELRSLCEQYNNSYTQNMTEIETIRQQLILLRSTVKHSNRISNIDKIFTTESDNVRNMSYDCTMYID